MPKGLSTKCLASTSCDSLAQFSQAPQLPPPKSRSSSSRQEGRAYPPAGPKATNPARTKVAQVTDPSERRLLPYSSVEPFKDVVLSVTSCDGGRASCGSAGRGTLAHRQDTVLKKSLLLYQPKQRTGTAFYPSGR